MHFPTKAILFVVMGVHPTQGFSPQPYDNVMICNSYTDVYCTMSCLLDFVKILLVLVMLSNVVIKFYSKVMT